jgi:hypothetical protein
MTGLTTGTDGKIKVNGRSQKSNEDSGFSNQESGGVRVDDSW